VLLFAPDARTLFFNTTIDTSIQAYSLPTGDLLPPAHTHPSTPNVLAASSNGDLLLSASPSPPTILIQDRRLAGLAPTHFKPTDSTTSVTCAAFDTAGLASRSLQTCYLALETAHWRCTGCFCLCSPTFKLLLQATLRHFSFTLRK
jgi:WD40 repeat protein